MAYIGNVPSTQRYSIDSFSGDGSNRDFTLRDAPVSPASIMVFVDGAYKSTQQYTVTGSNLNLNVAPNSGTNNIQVIFLGITTAIGPVTDGSVTGNKIANGTITGEKMGQGAISANNIAPATITGDKVAVGTLTGNLIYNTTITGDKIAVGTLTSNLLTSGTITGEKIADGTITTVKLSSGITGNLVGTSDTQTLTNKTISAANNDLVGVATTGKAIAMAIVFGG